MTRRLIQSAALVPDNDDDTPPYGEAWLSGQWNDPADPKPYASLHAGMVKHKMILEGRR